jgi:hypothetical protein
MKDSLSPFREAEMEDHFTHQYFSRQCFERHHAREVWERALCAGALLFGLTASFAACLFI